MLGAPFCFPLNQVDSSYRTELRELNELNFARLDAKVEQRVAELRADIANFRAELIKWMFIFWATSTFTTIGTLVALLKL